MEDRDLSSRFSELLTSHLPVDVERVGRAAGPFDDFELRLTAPGLEKRLRVQVEAEVRSSSIDAFLATAREFRENDADGMILLLAPAIDERVRRRLRELRLNHADLAGSLYIEEPGLLVRVDGERVHRPSRPDRAGFNPFADKSSLVLRALMREPWRDWGVRELADGLGISSGLVSMAAAELVRRGYARMDGGRLVMHDAARALSDWVSLRRWRYNRILSFHVPFEPDEMLHATVPPVTGATAGPAALTQLSGLDLYGSHVQNHGQVHLYLPAEAIPLATTVIETRVHGERTRGGGNFHLVQPAAKASTFFDSREVAGMQVVSPVQLFLDLAEYPIRGPEAATMLLRTVLAEELGLSRQEVARVASILE
jgi:hypothetical protein